MWFWTEDFDSLICGCTKIEIADTCIKARQSNLQHAGPKGAELAR
jgi:hypothetical protein